MAHVTGSVSRRAGGPFASIRGLVREQALIGCDVEVLGLTDESTEADRALWDPISPRTYTPRFPAQFGYAPALRTELEHLAVDLVHSHGLWMYPSWAAFRWARRHHKPHIISIRGMLEPWAFRYHAWKKRLVWIFWQRAALREAAVLHATSEGEAGSIRSHGFSNPIACIPNGVGLPDERFVAPHRNGRPRTALYLGRLHPVKHLPVLLRAWARLRPAGWRLVLAGPDDTGRRSELSHLARRLGVDAQVSFLGAVYGEQKSNLLQESNLFILPSRSENFGVVVAEALAHGIPVIASHGTPWKVLEETHCGWWVEASVEPLATALDQALSLSDAERRAMGERGRRLVEEKFCWPKIARQMKAVYEWVLGGGAKPDCVI